MWLKDNERINQKNKNDEKLEIMNKYCTFNIPWYSYALTKTTGWGWPGQVYIEYMYRRGREIKPRWNVEDNGDGSLSRSTRWPHCVVLPLLRRNGCVGILVSANSGGHWLLLLLCFSSSFFFPTCFFHFICY